MVPEADAAGRRRITNALTAIPPARHPMALSGDARATRVGEGSGGGDAGLDRIRYRYRLLPHISDTPLTTVNTAS